MLSHQGAYGMPICALVLFTKAAVRLPARSRVLRMLFISKSSLMCRFRSSAVDPVLFLWR
jgi:hypothetical protein